MSKMCRRCGQPVAPGAMGRPPIFCGPPCRNADAAELRRLRNTYDGTVSTVAYYRSLIERPVPGLGTPANARERIAEALKIAAEAATDIRRMKGDAR